MPRPRPGETVSGIIVIPRRGPLDAAPAAAPPVSRPYRIPEAGSLAARVLARALKRRGPQQDRPYPDPRRGQYRPVRSYPPWASRLFSALIVVLPRFLLP